MKCPECEGVVMTVRFVGKLFCFGKCYRYLTKEEIKIVDEKEKENKNA